MIYFLLTYSDIKPENVLFTRSMQLKLCDFGLAIDLREERAVTRAGTLEYMVRAPRARGDREELPRYYLPKRETTESEPGCTETLMSPAWDKHGRGM